MKKIILLLALSCSLTARAQITGSDTVCSGFIYIFDASIAGADSFAWSTPNAWVVLSGAGTSQLEVLATQNIGQVCVYGFDTTGNFIAQFCHDVVWGSGLGWDVVLTQATFCQCPGYSPSVVPNATGGGCGGCGNGVQSPNIVYAVYDNPWPTGNFVIYADGFSALAPPATTTMYYVYAVDITFGINNAILIEGSACPGTINNTFLLFDCTPVMLGIQQDPVPVCIGDTLTLQYDGFYGPFVSYQWGVNQGNVTLLPPLNNDTIQCIINSAGATEIWLTGLDANVCAFGGVVMPAYIACGGGQITGDSIVCAGYTYSYSASIPGAVTYNWTLPSGWYGLTGQGTSSISATCNVNFGNICVEGFDANMNSVGTQCITTQWGNGGAQGWDVVPPMVALCGGGGAMAAVSVQSNGTGTGNCPAGCGNGSQHPNLIYGVYDDALPYPQFIGEVGPGVIFPPGAGSYYVYYVDVTLGFNFPDAIAISGGCGAATYNNEITTYNVIPNPPVITQSPDPVCLGDTVILTQTQSIIYNYSWNDYNGAVILNILSSEVIEVLAATNNGQIEYIGLDNMSGCPTSLYYDINTVTCGVPTAAFTSTSNPICPGTCTGFSNTSTNASAYFWIFQGANPATDTSANPSTVCYNTPGSFDVTLIAVNPSGADTLTMPGYITVYPSPPAQNVSQSGDTLFSSGGFSTYQWYYNGNIIPGATDSFYVATQSGDYNLISMDANGCEVENAIVNVMVDIHTLSSKEPFSVFPNPAGDYISIRFNGQYDQIRIYNAIGQSCLSILPESTKSTTQVDIKTLIPGIYLIEVRGSDAKYRTWFVKQ